MARWILSPSSLKVLINSLRSIRDLFDCANFYIKDMMQREHIVYRLRCSFYYLQLALQCLKPFLPLDKATELSLDKFIKFDASREIYRVESDSLDPQLPF